MKTQIEKLIGILDGNMIVTARAEGVVAIGQICDTIIPKAGGPISYYLIKGVNEYNGKYYGGVASSDRRGLTTAAIIVTMTPIEQ